MRLVSDAFIGGKDFLGVGRSFISRIKKTVRLLRIIPDSYFVKI
jgi:hypothetical protein